MSFTLNEFRDIVGIQKRHDLESRAIQSRFMNVVSRKEYCVRFLPGLYQNRRQELGDILKKQKTVLITTPTVNKLFVEGWMRDLQGRDRDVSRIVIDCTESGKSLQQVEQICDSVMGLNIGREGMLVAIGGGVCSDLVSFSASLIRRGIKHMRIPTTLVGQIDAGIGLKCAVNFNGQKSYLGGFNAPESVLIDPFFLSTLSSSHISEGLAEIIKIALVCDARLFKLVSEQGSKLLESCFQSDKEVSCKVI